MLRFCQLVYVDYRPLSTSTADKMTVEVYSKLLSGALGPYRVTLTTSHTFTIDQDRIKNTFSADCALLAPTHVQLQNA